MNIECRVGQTEILFSRSSKLDEVKLREVCMLKIARFLNGEALVKKARKLMAESAKK